MNTDTLKQTSELQQFTIDETEQGELSQAMDESQAMVAMPFSKASEKRYQRIWRLRNLVAYELHASGKKPFPRMPKTNLVPISEMIAAPEVLELAESNA